MFYERIGCFYVGIKRLLSQQYPPLDIAKACSYEAWSRGLKYFAVRNGSECLGDVQFPTLLPGINASKGCFAGRGGQKFSDVYRLTGKRAFVLWNTRILGIICLSICFLAKSVNRLIHFDHPSMHKHICLPHPPFNCSLISFSLVCSSFLE